MNVNKSILSVMFAALFMTGCATSTPSIVHVQKPTVLKPQIQVAKQEPILKRKVAIARFSNEAQYSKSALFGVQYNAEKQATDILSAKLTQSGKFILLERSDYDKIEKELDSHNLTGLNINADYLILGSITEFGRKSESDTGVFSRTKSQVAYAKVSVRLVDVHTGQIIFAQEGSGEAISEAGTSFGLGKHVGYDSTLNDKAISGAIGSVVNGIMENLLNKPWRSFILSREAGSVIIAGGKKQGLRVGDVFNIFLKGKEIKNPQTGMIIELPGKKIASVRVVTQFGSNYADEGSVCSVINGSVDGHSLKDLYVQK